MNDERIQIETAREQRRLRTVGISAEILMMWIKPFLISGEVTNDTLNTRRITINGLPQDAEIINIRDAGFGTFDILVRSAEFDVLEPGIVPPPYLIEVITQDIIEG